MRIPRAIHWSGFFALAATLAYSQSQTWPPTYPTPQANMKRSYSDYYGSQVQSYHRPPPAQQYQLNRQMPQRSTVSPYMLLLRPQGVGVRTNAYYSFVRPEVARREATGVQPQAIPTANNNPYFNRMYQQP